MNYLKDQIFSEKFSMSSEILPVLSTKKELSDILKQKKKKKKREKEMKEKNIKEEIAYSHILEDIIIYEILTRVPPDVLHENCRYVCKLWNNIISTSRFIKENTAHAKKFTELIIQYQCSGGFGSRVLDTKEGKLLLDSTAPMPHMGQFRASTNGLILYTDPHEDGVLHVMNKVIKRAVKLPKCPSGCRHDIQNTCGCGIAFDRFSNAFKVVHIYADQFGFEIFTLGGSDKNWRHLPGPFKDKDDRPFGSDFRWTDPIFVKDGFLHWYIRSKAYIITMDVSDEKSCKTKLPSHLKDIKKSKIHLIEMGGFLSVVARVSFAEIEILILKDYHKEVWEKLHSIVWDYVVYEGIHRPKIWKVKPVLLRNSEVIFMHTSAASNTLYVYEFKLGKMRKLETKKFNYDVFYLAHTQSLVSWNNHGYSLKLSHESIGSQLSLLDTRSPSLFDHLLQLVDN